jgi:hypothetical protein
VVDQIGEDKEKRKKSEEKRKEKRPTNRNASKMLYFINVHLGPKRGVWFEKLDGIFC